MSALIAPVLIGAAALTIDQASLYNERRNIQRVVDLAAITAAGDIEHAAEAALAVLGDNGYRDVRLVNARPSGVEELAVFPELGWLSISTGRYQASAAMAATERFAAGGTRPNAVKVTFGHKGRRNFGSALLGDPWMTASATASARGEAAFSVGSRLAALDGGILNAVLGGLTGSTLSLSVMDYNALLSADVDLLTFLDALATELDISAGTYDDVLNSEASIGEIATALAKVSRAGSRERSSALAIAAGASSALKLPLSRVIGLGDIGSLGVGQTHAGVDLTAGLMEVLAASAAVANGTRQVAVNLGAQVPGLAALTLELAIGEPPQSSPFLAVGSAGTIVRTAQTRLMLRARVGGSGVLSGIAVNVPIFIQLASAEAKLESASCPPAARVTVAVRPGVADLRLAEVGTGQLGAFSSTPAFADAAIVAVPAISARGQAHVRIGNSNWSGLTFSASEISARSVKSVSTSSFAGSLTRSLANDLDLTVRIVGIDLGLSGLVRTAVGVALAGAAPVLDGVIVNLLQALGIRLGEADIRVHGLVCKRPVLVQ